jgi:hypothetical protein
LGNDIAKKIFDNAEVFHLAYNSLNNLITQDMRYLIPGAVNGALALELYMKCLYMLEKHELVKVHELEKIFDKLSTETKETLKNNFNLCLNTKEVKDQLSLMEKESKMKPPADFRGFIEEAEKVFLKARYFFEKEQFSFNCYPKIREVLIKRINELDSNINPL